MKINRIVFTANAMSSLKLYDSVNNLYSSYAAVQGRTQGILRFSLNGINYDADVTASYTHPNGAYWYCTYCIEKAIVNEGGWLSYLTSTQFATLTLDFSDSINVRYIECSGWSASNGYGNENVYAKVYSNDVLKAEYSQTVPLGSPANKQDFGLDSKLFIKNSGKFYSIEKGN